MVRNKRLGKVRTEFECSEIVHNCAQIGLTWMDIAHILEMHSDTAKMKYQKFFTKGRADAKRRIGQKLFEEAMNGNTPILIFWAKTQMRWRETDRLEVTGKDGGAIKVTAAVDAPRQESYEEWIERKEREKISATERVHGESSQKVIEGSCVDVSTGPSKSSDNGDMG